MERVCPRLSPGASLLVSRGDEILWRQGYGWADLERRIPARPDTSYLIASVTKQFVCVAALLLASDGMLDLDRPIADLAPELPPYKELVTPRHLMTHTSGIADYFTDEFIADYCQVDSPALDQDKLVEFICQKLPELKFKPGSRWEYSNSAYVILGWLIERVCGWPLPELLATRVFKPLGMEHTCMGDSDRRPPGMAVGYKPPQQGEFAPAPYNRTVVGWADGNMVSTCGDLHIWQRACQKGEVLPPELWRQVFTPHTLNDGQSASYGLGWFIWRRRGLLEYWHTGGTPGYRCRMSYFPREQVGLIMLLNGNQQGTGDINQPFGRLVHELLGDRLAPLPAWEGLPPHVAQQWSGPWDAPGVEGGPDQGFHIQADLRGRLTLRVRMGDDQAEHALLPQSQDLLWLDDGADYYMTRDLADEITLHSHGRKTKLVRKV